MDIIFKTKKLRNCYESSSLATQTWGINVARKYVQRLGLIKAAANFEDVKRLPGLDCHPLVGQRDGQWAIKLTGFYRLIFTLQGDNLEIVRIEEVSKHYDD